MEFFEIAPQIEELTHFDVYEELANDPYILDDEDLCYDDASFGDYLSSTNDF